MSKVNLPGWRVRLYFLVIKLVPRKIIQVYQNGLMLMAMRSVLLVFVWNGGYYVTKANLYNDVHYSNRWEGERGHNKVKPCCGDNSTKDIKQQ